MTNDNQTDLPSEGWIYHDTIYRYELSKDQIERRIRRAYLVGGTIGSLSTFGLIIVLLIFKELGI